MSSSRTIQPSVMGALSYSLLKWTHRSFGNLPDFWYPPENYTCLRMSENVTTSQVSVQDKGLEGKVSQVRLIERQCDWSGAELCNEYEQEIKSVSFMEHIGTCDGCSALRGMTGQDRGKKCDPPSSEVTRKSKSRLLRYTEY